VNLLSKQFFYFKLLILIQQLLTTVKQFFILDYDELVGGSVNVI